MPPHLMIRHCVKDVIEEKEMIPGGCKSKRKAINNQYDSYFCKGTLEEEMIHGG